MCVRIHILHPGAYMQCATYLLDGPEGAVIIDPGAGFEEETVLENLGLTGVSPGNVQVILLTHCHVDHAMGAGSLQRRFDWSLYASSDTAAALRRQDPQIWCEHPERIPAIEVNYVFEDDEIISPAGIRIQCLATPGHTAGSFSFAVETTANVLAVLTGDLIGTNGHPGWAGGPDFSEKQTLRSLQRLLDIQPHEAWWGHGGPIKRPQDWLKTAITLGQNDGWNLTKSLQFE